MQLASVPKLLTCSDRALQLLSISAHPSTSLPTLAPGSDLVPSGLGRRGRWRGKPGVTSSVGDARSGGAGPGDGTRNRIRRFSPS